MEQKLKAVMGSVFGMAPASISEHCARPQIPKWDSAAHIELVLALEAEFGIQFQDEEVISLVDYPSIRQAVQRRTAAGLRK